MIECVVAINLQYLDLKTKLKDFPMNVIFNNFNLGLLQSQLKRELEFSPLKIIV